MPLNAPQPVTVGADMMPALQLSDLTAHQIAVLAAIFAAPAFLVSGGWRTRRLGTKIQRGTINRLLDFGLIERRTTPFAAPYMRATARGQALVGSPKPPLGRPPRHRPGGQLWPRDRSM
jgi:hypothetical protein